MSQKDLTFINAFKITSAETDMYGNIRLSALSNLLIQSSINSANNLGFGFGNIREQNLFWVFSRLSIEIYHPIKWHDELIVETWPKNLDRILYLRDFIVRNKNGTVLANATSGWLAIDIEKKRPKLIDGLDANVFYSLKDKHAIEEPPLKLNTINGGETFTNKSVYSDIDLNKHVTATRYIDWMMDTFSLDFHKNNFPKKFSVNYLKETMLNETIIITKNQKDNICDFEGKNSSNNLPSFRARIDF